MPNWNSNTLVISKATNPQIERIIAACERQELLNEFMPQPIWDNLPNENGEYPGPEYSYRYYDRTRGMITRVWFGCRRFTDGKQDMRWYDWCVENWGTKWEAGEISITREGQDLFLTFETAWAPPSDAWIEALGAAMPNAGIRLTFSEPGCDFFGFTEIRDGKAYTEEGSLHTAKMEWVRATFPKWKIDIYDEDTEHENYDEIYEEIEDAWYEVQGDVLDEALEKGDLVPASY